MAIKINNTTVIDDSRNLVNVGGLKTINGYSILGSGNLVISGGLTYVVKTVNYTAARNEYVLADTSTSSFTVTLPATPQSGDLVIIADYAGTFGANKIIVDRNGSTIEDSASNINLSISRFEYSFVYTGTTWKIFSKQNLLGTTSSVYLTGPTVGNEATDIKLAIQGWTATDVYAITVTAGSYTQNTGNVTWTLPSVDIDTMHTMIIQVNGTSSYKHNVYVIAVPITADTSVSITDFSVKDYNDGWTV